MLHKVCLSELFVGEEQMSFWDKKESNEQGIWIDGQTSCTNLRFTEFKIKNGEAFSPCNNNY